MAADALNANRLSEDLLRGDEGNDNFGIVESGNRTESAPNTTLQPGPSASSNLALKKSSIAPKGDESQDLLL
jgi:hypothetical protein